MNENKYVNVFRHLTLLLMICGFSHTCHAGSEDVVYLKNGSIYRGVIVDQQAGQSYTIRIAGGSKIVLALSDVEKVRKEPRQSPLEYYYDSLRHRDIRITHRSYYYHYRQQGFTMQWQTIVGLIDGMRLSFGYRFNTYAALSLGSGFEYGNTVTPAPYAASNGYFPALLNLTGDILKTKWTPYYSVEIGYTFPMNRDLLSPSPYDYYYGTTPPSQYHSYGGVTSGVGFGLRKYFRNISFLLSINVNVGYLRIKTSDFQSYNPYPSQGPPGYYDSFTANYLVVQPSVRVGLCF